MTIWLKILEVLGGVFEFFKKHPKFFLGVVVAIFIMLFFKQCEDNRQLKNDIKQLETEAKNESNRTLNNVNALTDSIQKLNGSNTYLKTVVRAKNDETELLTTRLEKANKDIKVITKKLKDVEIRNIYITDISSEINTNDVLTNVTTTDSNTFAVGILDSNSVFSIETQSWFQIVPKDNQLKLQLLNKYGEDKSSFLNYKLNFSLTTSQIEMPDGKTRILIRPTDRFGNDIPPSILDIPFADGVDFIDVQPQVIKVPADKKRRTGFGAAIGPQYGLFYDGNAFRPAFGLGITVGYKIF